MSNNFLADYSAFTSGDEAPQNYHIWSGLSVLASVTARRIWINWGRFPIYTNLYNVLLGPPGNGKTTAMVTAKKLVRELGTVPFSAQAQTKESLVREMVEYERTIDYKGEPLVYTPVSVFVTELSHFLGPASGHMIDFLVTVYDQDVYDNKTKNKGNDLIVGPSVNLLACTTPQWITTYLRSDIISGGFTRRAIFVNEDEGTQRVAFPELSLSQLEARERALNHARRASNLIGVFDWSAEAKAFFTKWYLSFTLPTDLSVRWYYRTKHVQLMKVAMLIAVSESDDLVLKKHHIEIAMAMFDKIEVNLVKVFQGMGRNELHTVTQKLLETLSIAGGAMPEKQVLLTLGRDGNMNELRQIIDYLQKTDQIVPFEVKTNGTPRRMLGLKPIVEERLRQQEQQTTSDATAARLGPTPADGSTPDSPPSTDRPTAPS